MPFHSSSRLICRNLVFLRHLGLGIDSEIIAPKWERALGTHFASRHWNCFLLTSAFCPSPLHAAPSSLMEVLVFAPACGPPPDSGGLVCHQLASRCLPRSFLPQFSVWSICMCLPALGLPVPVHVRNSDLVCTVYVLACRFGRREPGLLLGQGL